MVAVYLILMIAGAYLFVGVMFAVMVLLSNEDDLRIVTIGSLLWYIFVMPYHAASVILELFLNIRVK